MMTLLQNQTQRSILPLLNLAEVAQSPQGVPIETPSIIQPCDGELGGSGGNNSIVLMAHDRPRAEDGGNNDLEDRRCTILQEGQT